MIDIPLQRVAAIHDLSGFGRASLTVAIPILSSMGVQVCPLPTAVLSSQTSGVEGFTFHDLTSEMGPILDHWERMGLKFDAVYSGFLGNPRQLEIAAMTFSSRAALRWWTRFSATTARSTPRKPRKW